MVCRVDFAVFFSGPCVILLSEVICKVLFIVVPGLFDEMKCSLAHVIVAFADGSFATRFYYHSA